MRINYRDEIPPSRDVLLAMAEAARRDEEWVAQALRECDWIERARYIAPPLLDGMAADAAAARAVIARALIEQ